MKAKTPTVVLAVTAGIGFSMLLSVAPVARAQDVTMGMDLINGETTRDLFMSDIQRDAARARRPLSSQSHNNTGGHSSIRGTSALKPIRSVQTHYQASPQVTARVKAQYVAYVNKIAGPSQAAQVRSELASKDPVRLWLGAVGGDGLKAGDVADALASYWILNWSIANNRVDNTRQQALGTRNQVRRILSANPAFAHLNNAQRQEIGEVFILNFLYQLAVYNDVLKRKDHALLPRLADAAVQRFRNEMGVDLRKLSLTDQGFVMQK